MLIHRLAPLAVLLAACSAAPVDPPAAPAPSNAPSTAPAPSASASSTASPAPAPSAAPAAAEDPGPPDPAPLTEAEQKEAEKLCKPLMIAVQKAKGSGVSPMEALTAALQKPPASLKPAGVARCQELLTRGIATYLSAAKEVEAKVVMHRIGQAVMIAYNETGSLCPSSEHAVPADRSKVAKEPYVSTDADWDTPSWKCLHFSLVGLPQRFQYEVKVDAPNKRFEILARGIPGNRFVELVQPGKVGSKEIELGGVERR